MPCLKFYCLKETMKILGIETSCDETAAAIVENGYTLHSSIIASQIAKHAAYGGVIPELAAREHLGCIDQVIKQAVKDAKMKLNEIDAIAVTQGPGLIPALLVGNAYAKSLSFSLQKPLIGVNHFLGHIYASFLDSGAELAQDAKNYPVMALVVSGGHTALILIEANGEAKLLGQTLDDAAGEAFDKAAKLLGLGYPGGPIIQKLGALGDKSKYHFPRSFTPSAGKKLRDEDQLMFSFSGVKTALLYHVQKFPQPLCDALLYDTIASYQEAIIDVLTYKTFLAAQKFNARSIVVCGGVACNGPLRERFTQLCPKDIKLYLARPVNCTDNAVMIAGLAYHQMLRGEVMDIKADVYAKLPMLSQFPLEVRHV